MNPRTKFGVCLPVFDGATVTSGAPDANTVRSVAVEAENLGYDSLWVPDHLMLGRGDSIFECWTTLSTLATATNRIRFGPLVLSYSHRSPSVLAKMAATLDYISGGRLIMGYGAGWYEREQLAYGLPWEPSPYKRIEMMREAIKLALVMWQGEQASFNGKYYSVAKAVCKPKPVQQPHPPIWIGGTGEKYLLRAVAELADGWNVPAMAPSEYTRKLSVIKDHCNSLGRDYNSIEKSMETRVMIIEKESEAEQVIRWFEAFKAMFGRPDPLKPNASTLEEAKVTYIIGTVGECEDRIREYIKAGVQHFTIYPLDLPSTRTLTVLSREIIPKL
ncbi:MAG: TIGR03560 family F420-dependent LLM class oxidoreductase [Thaumarchaeota archaeon]|nr:TIGR03560 family F420-dependent LLM class oxidoreductase [Nitrososphaerota archaeon]